MPKPKKINVQMIPVEGNPGIYAMLNELVVRFHPQLSDARIGLAWRTSTKADVDGRMVLGKCRKVSDLQKEFTPLDYIITLNKEVWEDTEFGEGRQRALLDHELCHAEPALDSNLDPKLDERNRAVWRMRKHDLEEFREIVDRHGIWKQDLEAFAKVILKKQREREGRERDESVQGE